MEVRARQRKLGRIPGTGPISLRLPNIRAGIPQGESGAAHANLQHREVKQVKDSATAKLSDKLIIRACQLIRYLKVQCDLVISTYFL